VDLTFRLAVDQCEKSRKKPMNPRLGILGGLSIFEAQTALCGHFPARVYSPRFIKASMSREAQGITHIAAGPKANAQ